MRRATIISGILCLSLVSACDMEGVAEEGEVGQLEQELGGSSSLVTNAILTNAILTNAILTNAILTNAILTNAILTNALDPDFKAAMSDADTRMVMQYLVECALDGGDSVKLYDAGGVSYTMYGAIGLAPEWKNGSCDTDCQEILSACLIARTNGNAVQTRISIEGGSVGRSGAEEYLYPWLEGATYGNLFRTFRSKLYGWYSSPTAYYAANTDGGSPIGTFMSLLDRICLGFAAGDCPVDTEGAASFYNVPHQGVTCDPSNVSRRYACTGGGDTCYSAGFCTTPAGTSYPNTMKVYQARRADSVMFSSGVHSEHEVGERVYNVWNTTMSPCGYHVTEVLGYTHCSDTAWDETCARVAVDNCGLNRAGTATSHSMCATGDPLFRGDADCITDICDTDPHCCQANGYWDASCVQKVGTVCGYDCNDSAVHGSDWNWSFCSATKPCSSGMGDCDNDSHCVAGNVCAHDVGAYYGKSSTMDVCESCRTGANFGWSFCTPGCPCGHGEGDCDSNADCRDGTVCKHNVGAKYGVSSTLDICERP